MTAFSPSDTPSYAVELRNVVKRFGDVVAVDRVSIQIQEGEFFSLLGPSGCGKTTTLRLIAGFEMSDDGEIWIANIPQGFLPAYRRPVNTVFQHYALFPHMTVFQNVAFGLEMQHISRSEIKRRVLEALELVHLSGMEKRRPRQLSGGQQQRVALARALVNRPKVLLLDEPLGALDLKLRKAMQLELKTLQQEVGITFIYVTHDQEEALVMSDRIAVMNKGQVLQVGAPQEIYESPSSRFVADFIGETNLLPGRLHRNNGAAGITLADGTYLKGGWVEQGLSSGASALLSIRPEKVHLLPGEAAPQSSGMACIPAQVEQVIYLGTDTRYILSMEGSLQIIGRQQNNRNGNGHFACGDRVQVCWDPHQARILKE